MPNRSHDICYDTVLKLYNNTALSSVTLDITICVQETWLKPCLDFVIPGYECLRADRENRVGGGCATFLGLQVTGLQY